MFMGEFHQKIDEKGRLTIPSKIRYELGEDFILTRGLDGCLFIYTKERWNNIIKNYEELPNIKETRNFMRFFMAGANLQKFDKQGRVNITPTLIKHANLSKDCVVIGVGERIEIWSLDNWNKFNEENEKNFSEIADNLFSGKIGGI